jgi:anti-sigma B factor antagonist
MKFPAMRLTLQSQLFDDVVVIRCQGRKKVVLQLANVDYVDSSGLGALLRMFSVLRAAGGDLKLCEVSPLVLQVLKITNLLTVFVTYPSAKEAIEAFSKSPRYVQDTSGSSKTRILCIDTSRDLLAYVKALLKRSGYEVFTSRYLGEALTLVSVTRPDVVICGADILGLPTGQAAVEKFRQSGPNVQILHLPADFSTAEAGQAGVDLVNRLQSLLAT